jgi:hypothetical protein
VAWAAVLTFGVRKAGVQRSGTEAGSKQKGRHVAAFFSFSTLSSEYHIGGGNPAKYLCGYCGGSGVE